MRDMNRVTLAGRLGADPVLRITKTGTHVTRLSLATSEYFRPAGADPAAEAQERTTWHKVVVWGKQANQCAQFLRKGRSVLIDGSLRTRSYVDDKEVKRVSVEVHAASVSFLGDAPAATPREGSVPTLTGEPDLPMGGMMGEAVETHAEVQTADQPAA